MQGAPLSGHVRIKPTEFRRLGEFIHRELGIKMPPVKKTMIESRLQRRLRALGMSDFKAYVDYVFSPDGTDTELITLMDLVTTNKTDFFREPAHFDYLVKHALPELDSLYAAGSRRPLRIWSAGCSTGEEPYTLAMVLSERSGGPHGPLMFEILATDISTQVLEKAHSGIYEGEKVAPIPQGMKKKYLLRSKDRASSLFRVSPEVRSRVRFRRINFMSEDYGVTTHMDVIFCRNVIIYFDRPTQQALLTRLIRHLLPGGYLFMGHSETLNGLALPIYQVAPTVYRKHGA